MQTIMVPVVIIFRKKTKGTEILTRIRSGSINNSKKETVSGTPLYRGSDISLTWILFVSRPVTYFEPNVLKIIS